MSATTQNPIERIGESAWIDLDGFRVEIEILDTREVYGRTEYYVRPKAGSGERWVQGYRVSFAHRAS